MCFSSLAFDPLFVFQIFLGNANERNEIISNIIDPAIITRFIQIRVKTVRGHPALRAEFYGCTGGTFCNINE